jgi:hypothetical protein
MSNMDLTSGESIPLPKILSTEEMWSIVKGQDNSWGIEGYQVPREYWDYKQMKWNQEVAAMCKKPKADWPPSRWPKNEETGKPIPPKRPNYLDIVTNWAKSCYDPKRAEEVRQAYLDKRGKEIDAPNEKPKQEDQRKKFLEYEKEKNQKMEEMKALPPWKQEAIDNYQSKLAEKGEPKKEKNFMEKMKEKYGAFKSLPQCERITIVSDSEYVGEKLPFYVTPVNPDEEEGEEGKSKKKPKKLFWPDVR